MPTGTQAFNFHADETDIIVKIWLAGEFLDFRNNTIKQIRGWQLNAAAHGVGQKVH